MTEWLSVADTAPDAASPSVAAPMSVKVIESLIPHRWPFLLVDRVTEINGETSIKGYKNVTGNEEFFIGHFPGNPVMPEQHAGVPYEQAANRLGSWTGLMAQAEFKDVLIRYAALFESWEKFLEADWRATF